MSYSHKWICELSCWIKCLAVSAWTWGHTGKRSHPGAQELDEQATACLSRPGFPRRWTLKDSIGGATLKKKSEEEEVKQGNGENSVVGTRHISPPDATNCYISQSCLPRARPSNCISGQSILGERERALSSSSQLTLTEGSSHEGSMSPLCVRHTSSPVTSQHLMPLHQQENHQAEEWGPSVNDDDCRE